MTRRRPGYGGCSNRRDYEGQRQGGEGRVEEARAVGAQGQGWRQGRVLSVTDDTFAATCRRLGWSPPPSTYPACRDCGRHFTVAGSYLCRLREADMPQMYTVRMCSQMRDDGVCGPEGRLFVKRPSWWRRVLTYLFDPLSKVR